MFASTVVEVAAPFGQKRMDQQFTVREAARNHTRTHNLEVLLGLFLIPGRGPGRKRLQPHGRTPAMAGNTTGVAIALGQEDGLYFCLEELEIQSRRRGRRGFLGSQRSSGWTLGQQCSHEQQQQGNTHKGSSSSIFRAVSIQNRFGVY